MTMIDPANPEPDRPHDPDLEALPSGGPNPKTPEEDLQAFGLVREPPPPDHHLRHAQPLKPEGYFAPEPTDGE